MSRQIVRLTSCSLRKSDVLIRLRQAEGFFQARGEGPRLDEGRVAVHEAAPCRPHRSRC